LITSFGNFGEKLVSSNIHMALPAMMINCMWLILGFIGNHHNITRSVGTKSQGNRQLDGAVGVCLSAEGEYVLVSELCNNRISVLNTSDLSFFKHIGSKGNETNQLDRLNRLYCDEHGTIFVADNLNHRMSILNL
jgi:hypothetical protein